MDVRQRCQHVYRRHEQHPWNPWRRVAVVSSERARRHFSHRPSFILTPGLTNTCPYKISTRRPLKHVQLSNYGGGELSTAVDRRYTFSFRQVGGYTTWRPATGLSALRRARRPTSRSFLIEAGRDSHTSHETQMNLKKRTLAQPIFQRGPTHTDTDDTHSRNRRRPDARTWTDRQARMLQ